MLRRLPAVVARIPTKIHTKVLVAFMLIVAMLVALGAVGLLALRESNRRADELIVLQRKIDAYQQLQRDTTGQLYRINAVLVAPSEENVEAIQRQLEQFRYDFARLEFVAKEEVELHGRVKVSRERFMEAVRRMLTLVKEGKTDASLALQQQEVGPAVERLNRDMMALVHLAQADMIEHGEVSRVAYLASRASVVGFAVGSLAMAFALGYAVSGSLLGPVALMAQRVREIASGDFSRKLEIANRDELGELGRDINLMNDQLDGLYKERELHIRFLRQTFGRYLSDDIVSRLIDSPTGLSLGGQKQKVTLLLSDLRGFTSLSETLSPEGVVRLLNRYLGAMAEIILEHQGTIDEFIGDAIFVIFGAPLQREDDAQRAVRCAVAMQQRMADVNADNLREGLPAISMGIGVHTGEVVVGNIGSDRRAKYGVIGRNVNLTSRIESLTVGAQVLISDATRRELGSGVEVGQKMSVTTKGIEAPVEVYELRSVGSGDTSSLPPSESPLSPLRSVIALRWVKLVGKSIADEEHHGQLVRLSSRGGEIVAEHQLQALDDVKISLLGQGDDDMTIYGKVVSHSQAASECFFVDFSYVSPAAAGVLKAAAGGGDLTTAGFVSN